MKTFLIIALVVAIAPILYVIIDIIIHIFALLLIWMNINHIDEEDDDIHEKKIVENGDRD